MRFVKLENNLFSEQHGTDNMKAALAINVFDEY